MSYVDDLAPNVALADARAFMVRMWRMEGESWRGVADRAGRAWGIDYRSSRNAGRDLCRYAAAWLGEDHRDPPWADEYPIYREEWW